MEDEKGGRPVKNATAMRRSSRTVTKTTLASEDRETAAHRAADAQDDVQHRISAALVHDLAAMDPAVASRV